jgi:hypothetical protein
VGRATLSKREKVDCPSPGRKIGNCSQYKSIDFLQGFHKMKSGKAIVNRQYMSFSIHVKHTRNDILGVSKRNMLMSWKCSWTSVKKATAFVIFGIAFVLVLCSSTPSHEAVDQELNSGPTVFPNCPQLLISQVELTDGVTVSGVLDAEDDYDMYLITVGAFASGMRAVLEIPSDTDFDVYGQFDELPTTSAYDWRGVTTTGEDVYYSFPNAGTWYIMVYSYTGAGQYNLTVSVDHGDVEFPGVLESGVTSSGSLLNEDDIDIWEITIVNASSSMRVVLDCGDNDFDLYASWNRHPTWLDNDWQSVEIGREDYTFDDPEMGTWYIMVHAFTGAGSYNLTLLIEYKSLGVLVDGITSNGSLLNEDDIDFWEITIVNASSSMRVVLDCGDNDFDLYAAWNRYPTNIGYDWRSAAVGGEDYSFDDPEVGIWYIMVYAFSGTGPYEITVILEPSDGFGFFENLLDIFGSPLLFFFVVPAFFAVVCILVARSCRRKRVDRGFVLGSDRSDMYRYGQTYEPRYCTYCGTLQKHVADICHECGARIPDTW